MTRVWQIEDDHTSRFKTGLSFFLSLCPIVRKIFQRDAFFLFLEDSSVLNPLFSYRFILLQRFIFMKKKKKLMKQVKKRL